MDDTTFELSEFDSLDAPLLFITRPLPLLLLLLLFAVDWLLLLELLLLLLDFWLDCCWACFCWFRRSCFLNLALLF